MRGCKKKEELIKRRFGRFSVKSLVLLLTIIVVFIAIVTVLLKVFDELFSPASYLLNKLTPVIASHPYVTRINYTAIAMFVSAVLAISVVVQIFRRMFPRRIVRDKNYVLSLFSERNGSGPAPTREVLFAKIYGKGKIEESVHRVISQSVDKNIDKIRKFIDDEEKNESILCISSKWGSGKTTSLLIAINESVSMVNRYIYEAAFKYSGDVDEYVNDILNTLEDSMLESGIRVSGIFSSLVDNLDSDVKKTVFNMVKGTRDINTLTTDLVLRLNDIYYKSKAKNKKTFILVVDDLDRLQGGDIVRILSLLSVVKNLIFVKIVVLADLDVVCEALDRHGVVDATRFIEKYLPDARSIGVNSGCELTERVLIEKISSAQAEWNKENDGVYPAVAAIFIGMLAKKMRDETRKLVDIRHHWLSRDNARVKTAIGNVNECLSQLLDAPVVLSNRSQGFDGIYGWDNYNNITRFQNIIYALNWRRDNTGVPHSIRGLFSDDDYIAVVDSWIFAYMEKRWDLFGFTIRDALDMLESVDYRGLSKRPAEQFIQVFNQLFPKEQLEFDEHSAEKVI